MSAPAITNAVEVRYGGTGASQAYDERGMRPMQARVWQDRGAQHLLVKAPPASGKSRALMFVALDKLENQGLAKAIVAVPERSIGASFADEPLSRHGFFADWTVKPEWNLCTPGAASDAGKIAAFGRFLASPDRTLVCTHATLRFAFERLGAEAFDECLLAVDEFHHASSDTENRLGEVVRALMARDRAHIVAMTGSYFRGDQMAVMRPEDEARFTRVTYTYYEQLDGYRHLKTLGIGYHFYRGRYLDAIGDVLDPALKTILHIPHVGSAESTKDKYGEVDHILGLLGTYRGNDLATGFTLVERPDGRMLKVANLVEDDPAHRDQVMNALRTAKDRDAVDIVIALGMAKEGFDWIWCEHALTVGYRASLTEVVQIIGRATRDAPGKHHAQFTNLVAEPLAAQGEVVTGVNDVLKAITASLLMEQVLAPRLRFHAHPPDPDVDDGQAADNVGGSNHGSANAGFGAGAQAPFRFDEGTGTIHISIPGLSEPKTERVRDIVENDLNDLLAAVVADDTVVRPAVAGDRTPPEVINQVLIPRVIEQRYPGLDADEIETVRQHLVSGMAVLAQANAAALDEAPAVPNGGEAAQADGSSRFLDLVRRFVNVSDLSIDLIDSINPFQQAYEVLSKSMDAPMLARIHSAIAAGRSPMTEEEATALWPRIQNFAKSQGRPPSAASGEPLEKRLGQALEWLRDQKRRQQSAAVVPAEA